MNQTNTDKHTISLLVSNKPGVLTRIALVFARRGFNIDSLVVSKGKSAEFSRMNIEASGDSDTLTLMLAQLNKLVDVIKAIDHSNEDIIQNEMALIKIRCKVERRTELLQISDTFRCQTVDISEDTMTLQITGKSDKIDAFIKMISTFEIMELVRTGKVLMARGDVITA